MCGAFSFFDIYRDRFGCDPILDDVLEIANIISWNFFQMDGIRYVLPASCYDEIEGYESLFYEEEHEEVVKCPGCIRNDPELHNGIYAYTMDWETDQAFKLVELRRS